MTPRRDTTIKWIGYINVKDYGAYGDNSHDDTTAVSNGMAAAISGGTRLYFPPGTYLADITLSDTAQFIGSSKTDSWLKGTIRAGANTEVQHMKIGIDGQQFGPSYGDDMHGSVFRDCTFTGGHSSGGLIYIGDYSLAYDVLFADCDFDDHGYTANLVTIKTYGGASDQKYNFLFDNCHFMGCGRMNFECTGEEGTPTFEYPFHDIVLRDCTFEATDDTNISFAAGIVDSVRTGGHITIDGCTIVDATVAPVAGGTCGIELNNLDYATVRGCTIGGASGTHLVNMIGMWSTIADYNSYNVIEDNILNGKLSSGSRVILKASAWQFKGNTVHVCSSYGVTTHWGGGALIEDNEIVGWDYSGQDIGTSRSIWTCNRDGDTYNLNTFRSANTTSPVHLNDTGITPAGYSVNNDFTYNTFNRVSGASNIWADTNSDFDESNSTYQELT